MLVSTTNEIAGYKVLSHIGMVRGGVAENVATLEIAATDVPAEAPAVPAQ